MSDHDKIYSTKFQDKVERSTVLMFVLVAIAVAIGGIVEIIPLFYLDRTMTHLSPDVKGKVDSKELGEIKGKIMELKELLKPDKKDIPVLRKKLDEVNQLVQKASTELYQKASQQQASHGSQEGKSGKKDDNVVDADYEVKDEKKKK